jgi:superfamily I DNA and/or RNA helicase
MERNIIIISTVRSNKQFKEEKGRRIPVDNNKYPFALGFARELQRINVGFSRAKRLLIVVGNEKHFSHKPEYAAAIQKMHRVDLLQIQNLITQ